MIDDQLTKAKKRVRKDTQTRILIAVGLSVLALGLVGGASYVATQKRSGNDAASAVPAVDKAAGAPQDRAVDNAARETFKDALATFELEIEPLLEKPGLADWAPDRLSQAESLKTEAIRAFAARDYATAQETLKEAAELVRTTVSQWRDAFEQAYDAAARALAEEAPDKAQLHIQKALTIRPNSDDAADLAERIAALPKVLAYLESARVADIENDIDAEIAALRNVLSLDPRRPAAKERLARLQKEQREVRFATHMKAATAALDRGELDEAQSRLAQALNLYPGRAEATALGKEIAAERRARYLAAQLRRLEALAGADRWAEVVDLSGKLLRDYSGHTRLRGFLETGREVTAAKRRLGVYIDDPNRLSDPTLLKAARADRAAVEHLTPVSAEVAEQVATVGRLIDAYDDPVPVFVESDGKTEIAVIGVGQVGKTTGREIELPPGEYVFEGRRRGYRSKRVDLTIPPGRDDPMTVRVVTDERI
mgnify:CR=1 FL=1